jgi:ankyrin repeat protein
VTAPSLQPWAEEYPLHKAACEGDVAALRSSLAASAGIDVVDCDGWTPLHYAAWCTCTLSIFFLGVSEAVLFSLWLIYGIPLWLASRYGQDEMVSALIEAGTSLSATVRVLR